MAVKLKNIILADNQSIYPPKTVKNFVTYIGNRLLI